MKGDMNTVEELVKILQEKKLTEISLETSDIKINIKGYLTPEENEYFKKITSLLDLFEIKYTINKNLVRGLDYYNGIVFEFVSKDPQLTAQSTLIGGGRYDSLVKQTGGPDVKGIGFGLGVERIIIAMGQDNDLFNQPQVDVIILPFSEAALNLSYMVANILRLGNGLSCNISNKTFKPDKHFKYVDKFNCKYALLIKDDLIKNDKVILKDQANRQEEELTLEEAINKIKANH